MHDHVATKACLQLQEVFTAPQDHHCLSSSGRRAAFLARLSLLLHCNAWRSCVCKSCLTWYSSPCLQLHSWRRHLRKDDGISGRLAMTAAALFQWLTYLNAMHAPPACHLCPLHAAAVWAPPPAQWYVRLQLSDHHPCPHYPSLFNAAALLAPSPAQCFVAGVCLNAMNAPDPCHHPTCL